MRFWLAALGLLALTTCGAGPVAAGAEVAPADLAHGDEQVARMLADRPAMARHVRRDDPVWRWAAVKFAGVDVGQRIYWDAGAPQGDYEAEHTSPFPGQRASIRVRNQDPRGRSPDFLFEVLWGAAAFELHNISKYRQFAAVYDDAIAGKVTKEEWILRNTRIEHEALKDNVRFYRSFWLPWAKAAGRFESDGRAWDVETPDSYEEWFRRYLPDQQRSSDPWTRLLAPLLRSRDGYPWDSWGKWYDDELVPYLEATGRWPVQRR